MQATQILAAKTAAAWPFNVAPKKRAMRSLDDLTYFFNYGYDVASGICTLIGSRERLIKQGPTLEVRAWLRARYLREVGARNRRMATA